MSVATAPCLKSVAFTEMKSLDDEQGIFEGYLSVFGNVDSYRDIVEPGAFTKTINDARGKKGKYLFPLLWQHDPREPIGGFIEMQENQKGLYVQAQIDLNTPLGNRAYSGLKMGYLQGLSIGYDTIKHKYVSDVRHLLEVRMWEGSIVTFPANKETLVSGIKAVCGDTDFPIGPRNESWDSGQAQSQILSWAKQEDGTLDTEKMKSVHLRVEGDPQNSTSYSYPFCYIKLGKPEISVGAVKACAAALQGARGADAGEDTDGMKTKIATLYARITAAYPDDPKLIPPWSKKHDPGIPRDFHTVLGDREPDQLMEELYDLLGALLTSIVEQLSQGDSVGNDATKEAVSTCLDQFKETVLDWVDDALYIDLFQPPHPGNDGDNDADDEEEEKRTPLALSHFTLSIRAMKWATKSFIKEGRMLSSVNKTRITSAITTILTAMKDLQQLIGDERNEYDPGNDEPEEDPKNPQDQDPQEKDEASGPQVREEEKIGPIQPVRKEAEEEPTEEMLFALRLLRMRKGARHGN